MAAKIADSDIPYANLVEDESHADYSIRAEDGLFITTKPGDSRAIVLPIEYRNESGLIKDKVDIVYADLIQMAKWTFLRNLEHRPAFTGTINGSETDQLPVELKVIQAVFEDGEEIEVEHDVSRGAVSIDMTHDLETSAPISKTTKKPCSKMRLELTNRSDKPLYCSLLYMTQEFGVNAPLFPQKEFWLRDGDTNQSIRPGGKPYLLGTLANYIREDRWSGVTDFLKLIVSETQFDAGTLAMDDLPAPRGSVASERGAWDAQPDPELPRSYWSTHTVELFTANYDS